MRWQLSQVFRLMTGILLLLALGPAISGNLDVGAVLLLGAAGLAVGVVLCTRYLAVLIISRTITVGSRSRDHRQQLSFAPAPSHPNTVGRVRSRAPGTIAVVA